MLKNTLLFVLLIITLAGSDAFASEIDELTAESLQSRIQQEGAKNVVNALNQGEYPTAFDEIARRIASGKSSWVKIAPALAAGTDAGTSTALIVSLVTALPENPSDVLSALDESSSILTTEKICSAPFIEPEADFLQAYLKRTEKALEKRLTEPLDTRRKNCLIKLLNIHLATQKNG